MPVKAMDVDKAQYLMQRGYMIDWNHRSWVVFYDGKRLDGRKGGFLARAGKSKNDSAAENMKDAIACAEEHFYQKRSSR